MLEELTSLMSMKKMMKQKSCENTYKPIHMHIHRYKYTHMHTYASYAESTS